MKRAIFVLCCVLFALVIFFPLCTALAACFGYTFELFSVPVFGIAIAALSVLVAVLSIIYKAPIKNKALCILMAIIMPLAQINVVFYVFKCSQPAVFVSAVICAGCCLFLGIKHSRPKALKIAALVLAILMILPAGFIGFIGLLAGNIGQDTVVQMAESPDGKHYAQLIASDQGAFGGDTIVYVYKRSGLNLLLFIIEKKPQRLFLGEWGQFEHIQIRWKDESCVLINSAEYEIE